MAKRQRNQNPRPRPAHKPATQRGQERSKADTREKKPVASSRSTDTSEPVSSAAETSAKRLNRFQKVAAGFGLAKLSESNSLLMISGEPFVPDALSALPQPKREFTICCKYRLLMPVTVPYACAFVPEPPSEEDVFPRRRSLVVNFGTAGKSYAYVRHEGAGHLPGLSVCRIVDAAVLFRDWLEALQMATWSVNSSPTSPEYFDITPKEHDFDNPSLTTIMTALGMVNA